MDALSTRGSLGLVRSIPIFYIPDKSSLCVFADPVSPEYLPVALIRSLPLDSSKWMPLPGNSIKHHLFGLRFLPKDLRRIVLVEGIFDVLTPGLLGQAVALLGTKLRDSHLACFRHLGIDKVYVWMDSDEPGRRAAEEIQSQLFHWGIGAEIVRCDSEPGDLHPEHPQVQWVVGRL